MYVSSDHSSCNLSNHAINYDYSVINMSAMLAALRLSPTAAGRVELPNGKWAKKTKIKNGWGTTQEVGAPGARVSVQPDYVEKSAIHNTINAVTQTGGQRLQHP